MRSIATPSLISSLLFFFTTSALFSAMAQDEATDGAAMATIISPIDTSSLKGRMASAEKAAQARTAAQMAAETAAETANTAPSPETVKTPKLAASARVTGSKSTQAKQASVAKPPKPRKIRPAASQAPLLSRGDQFSYRHRGLLKAQVDGDNRFGGHTFALPVDILTLDHADALAGFMSFDNLGTLRERKIYRANGSAEVSIYDPRSGNIVETKTESVSETDGLTAGGISVMPGTNFGALLANAAKTKADKPSQKPRKLKAQDGLDDDL